MHGSGRVHIHVQWLVGDTVWPFPYHTKVIGSCRAMPNHQQWSRALLGRGGRPGGRSRLPARQKSLFTYKEIDRSPSGTPSKVEGEVREMRWYQQRPSCFFWSWNGTQSGTEFWKTTTKEHRGQHEWVLKGVRMESNVHKRCAGAGQRKN